VGGGGLATGLSHGVCGGRVVQGGGDDGGQGIRVAWGYEPSVDAVLDVVCGAFVATGDHRRALTHGLSIYLAKALG